MLNILKLHLSARWFAKAEVKHQRELKENEEAWGKIDEEEILQRVKRKRRGIYTALALVLVSLLLGVVSAELVNLLCPVSESDIRWLRLLSVLLIAWAVLGRLGYESETIGGRTLLEKTSMASFKVFYIVALYWVAFTLFIVPNAT